MKSIFNHLKHRFFTSKKSSSRKVQDIKEILLTSDGNINEEGINQYIETYQWVDAEYNNPDSEFNGQTLLCVAITHPEINPHTKIRLATHLIKKGAIASRVGNHMEYVDPRHDELIDIALEEKNYEAANLLLQEGWNINGSFYNAYARKNLIDIALDTKNEEILSWILQNAPTLFSQIVTPKFEEYYKKIIQIFPGFTTSQNYLILKQLAEERIDYLFTKLGLIRGQDIALILAAKMSTKPYPNSVFVINKGEQVELMAEQIKKLLENETSEKITKFQIVYFQGHGCYGEFEIDKSTQPPTVRYVHIDPSPQLIPYNVLITENFVKTISPLANIEIFESDLKMQKGASCTFFAVYGAMQLSTPTTRDYVPNVIEHMKKQGQEMPHKFQEINITYVRSPTLPARLMLGLHFIEDTTDRKGLDSLIFNSPEKDTIVNKKGETAAIAVRKDLQGHASTSNQTVNRTWNMRIERKMKQYGEAVHVFIKENNIDVLTPSFSSLLDQYSLKGLVQFCEDKLYAKSESDNCNINCN
ncbi:hypothetical protein [Legionella hackeliae]|uniref:Ankyrin repeat-containing protein n=1 Tax=Legionella hackeliae TaxID=449 RepID=A0A0A8URB1_LEGHA|nr:hypothetical protein [Legionella hackeliae]KTD13471.1 hypothetical protein Lhac_0855 [Legionella hackeliae]CEK09314.1 protein of unknown function [Legionella hackeliae]STX49219.1 Uncharacterised protein [Legionella hackeliae]